MDNLESTRVGVLEVVRGDRTWWRMNRHASSDVLEDINIGEWYQDIRNVGVGEGSASADALKGVVSEGI